MISEPTLRMIAEEAHAHYTSLVIGEFKESPPRAFREAIRHALEHAIEEGVLEVRSLQFSGDRQAISVPDEWRKLANEFTQHGTIEAGQELANLVLSGHEQ